MAPDARRSRQTANRDILDSTVANETVGSRGESNLLVHIWGLDPKPAPPPPPLVWASIPAQSRIEGRSVDLRITPVSLRIGLCYTLFRQENRAAGANPDPQKGANPPLCEHALCKQDVNCPSAAAAMQKHPTVGLGAKSKALKEIIVTLAIKGLAGRCRRLSKK